MMNKENVCHLHGMIERNFKRIQADLMRDTTISDDVREKIDVLLAQTCQFIVLAIERTTAMEKRLALYHNTIVNLGFERKKDGSESPKEI